MLHVPQNRAQFFGLGGFGVLNFALWHHWVFGKSFGDAQFALEFVAWLTNSALGASGSAESHLDALPGLFGAANSSLRKRDCKSLPAILHNWASLGASVELPTLELTHLLAYTFLAIRDWHVGSFLNYKVSQYQAVVNEFLVAVSHYQ